MDQILRKKGAEVHNAVISAKYVCAAILAGTSFILYNSFVPDLVADLHLPRVIHSIISGLLIFGVLYATDGTLHTLLNYVLVERFHPDWVQDKTKKKNANRRQFVRLLAIVVFVQAVITGTTSFWSAEQITDMTVEKVETSDYLQAAERQNASFQKTLDILNGDHAKAEKTAPDRIAQAKKDGHQVVISALQSGPSRWQKLFLDGNDWFMTHPQFRGYISKVQQARKDSAQMVQKQIDLAPSLLAQKTQTASQGMVQNNATIMALGDVKQAEIKRNERQRKIRNWTLIIVDFVALFGLIFFSILDAKFKVSTMDQTELTPQISAGRIARIVLTENWNRTMKHLAEQFGVSVSMAGSGVPVSVNQIQNSPETVQKTPSISVSPEISKPETVQDAFEIVSKNGVNAIWVPGFNTEPFSLTQCNQKLKQYEYKLKHGKGKPETARANIDKFQRAIKILNNA